MRSPPRSRQECGQRRLARVTSSTVRSRSEARAGSRASKFAGADDPWPSWDGQRRSGLAARSVARQCASRRGLADLDRYPRSKTVSARRLAGPGAAEGAGPGICRSCMEDEPRGLEVSTTFALRGEESVEGAAGQQSPFDRPGRAAHVHDVEATEGVSLLRLEQRRRDRPVTVVPRGGPLAQRVVERVNTDPVPDGVVDHEQDRPGDEFLGQLAAGNHTK